MNPFKYGCIVGGEYFCQRPLLEREIRRFVESGQNVVVQGERRMGKTSLVCETVRGIKGVKLLYVDLLGVKSVSDFCRKVMAAVVRLDRSRGFLDRTAALLRRLRPTFSIDPATGSPTLSVDLASSSRPESFEDVLDMLAAHAAKMRLCIVFDEFQDMLKIDGADSLLATMRGKIQFQSDTAYFFLGSVRNEMAAMFSDSRSPFYKSAALFDIGRIEDDVFAEFLIRRFKVGKRKIGRPVMNSVLEIADRVSGDVQELCDALWASTMDGAEVEEKDIGPALELIYARESKAYTPIITRLTDIQHRVLRGIAEYGADRPLGGEFLERVGVRNAGSVRKAILRMVDMDILYQRDGVYRFGNPFFRMWLRTR